MKEGKIMNIICGWNVANSFIKKSFEDKIYITPLKLNCLIYLLYSEYLFKTGEKIFDELFIKTEKGPVLPTIEFKFGCFKNNVITQYAKDARNNVMLVNGDFFEEILYSIWNKYKNMGYIEILTFINDNNLICNKENNDYIYDQEILEDEIKRKQITLGKAKRKYYTLIKSVE